MKDSENVIGSVDVRSPNYQNWVIIRNKLERQEVLVNTRFFVCLFKNTQNLLHMIGGGVIAWW